MNQRLFLGIIAIGVLCCTLVLLINSVVGEACALGVGLLLILFPVSRLFTEQYELQQEVGQLEKVVRLNEYWANHDALTKLKNRYYFDIASNELDRPEHYPLSVILADVDNLKEVNDQHGHLAGDNVLIKVAQLLRASCRQDDVVVRWGGDEFVILLPRTDEAGCAAVQERIKKACAERNAGGYQLSLSMGAATKADSKESLLEVLQRADQALYRQKHLARMARIERDSMDVKRAGG